MSRTETYEDPTIISPEEREMHFWQKDHVRLFGQDYPNWLERAGFEVETFDLTKHYDAPKIERFRLIKDEILYIFKK
jgi:hypothetical protein